MDHALIAPDPHPASAARAPDPAPRGRPPRVEILLSTYNGARFLPELLASLSQQVQLPFRLQVRDDGSTDGTVELLEEYTRAHPGSVERGTHVGVPESFFRVLRAGGDDADLFGFCDQDDVWLPHKIAAAAAVLGAADPAVPALYCSSLTPVDATLKPLRKPWVPKRPLGFLNALVENRVSGCTLVFNRAARDLLLRHVPRGALMHDHWTYLVVSAFGTVYFDPEPSLLYRQHGQNTVGISRGYLSRVRGLRKRRGMASIFAQAEEFRAVYGAHLDASQGAALDRFLASRDSVAKRLGYALTADTYRHRRTDDVVHRLLIALGLF